MSALEVLKTACLSKSFKSFKNLDVGDYVVYDFQRIATDFGARIRIELHDCTMYLPERFSNMLTDEHLTELNDSTVVMSFTGKDPNAQNRLLLDFEIIRVDDAGEMTSVSVITNPPRDQALNLHSSG